MQIQRNAEQLLGAAKLRVFDGCFQLESGCKASLARQLADGSMGTAPAVLALSGESHWIR